MSSKFVQYSYLGKDFLSLQKKISIENYFSPTIEQG